MVKNAGTASPRYSQLISFTLPTETNQHPISHQKSLKKKKKKTTHFLIIKLPTITSAPPVAQGGIDAKIGAKNTDTKNASPVNTAVSPVLPPSVIPVADSMNAVTGDVPISAPMEIENASTQYAVVDPSKSSVMGSRSPANLAME